MSKATMSWAALVVGGLLEVVWAGLLNAAGPFDRLDLLAAGLAISVVSVVLLAWAMKSLPLGTGYAAWIGIGVIGSVVVGIVVFGEPATIPRLGLIGAVVVGIVGLQLTTVQDAPDLSRAGRDEP